MLHNLSWVSFFDILRYSVWSGRSCLTVTLTCGTLTHVPHAATAYAFATAAAARVPPLQPPPPQPQAMHAPPLQTPVRRSIRRRSIRRRRIRSHYRTLLGLPCRHRCASLHRHPRPLARTAARRRRLRRLRRLRCCRRHRRHLVRDQVAQNGNLQ